MPNTSEDKTISIKTIMPPQHLKQQHGFTLIEIVAVLLLVGIVSAIAVSKIGIVGSSVDVIAETGILKINLRYAQVRAMNSTYYDIWRVNFTSSGYTLQQYDNASSTWLDRSLPSETDDLDSDGIKETRNFKGSVSKSSGPNIIRFDSWGIPVTPDRETPIVNNITINLTDGTNSKSLTITKNTGYIP